MKIAKYVLATFALLLSSYDTTFACRCPRGKPSPDLSRFEAVFVGKVVDEGDFGSSPRKVKFRVERFWKGEITGEVVMHAINNSCDWYFKKDESYLVYAYTSADGRALRTHKCTRTRRLTDAADDLKVLGEGQVPSSQRVSDRLCKRQQSTYLVSRKDG